MGHACTEALKRNNLFVNAEMKEQGWENETSHACRVGWIVARLFDIHCCTANVNVMLTLFNVDLSYLNRGNQLTGNTNLTRPQHI